MRFLLSKVYCKKSIRVILSVSETCFDMNSLEYGSGTCRLEFLATVLENILRRAEPPPQSPQALALSIFSLCPGAQRRPIGKD